jgi:hypothetical protein
MTGHDLSLAVVFRKFAENAGIAFKTPEEVFG